MEYTGERLIPGKKGLELLELEHRTRYMLAREFAQGRAALDLGSGAGYGAALLAEVAATVVGVDVSEEAVAFAQSAYGPANLQFVVGDLCADDLVDRVRAAHPAPFGCVTCFEVLEHIAEPLKMLDAVRELLEPDGVLLVSTPNIDFPYDADKVNPHHVIEYTLDDFRQLLEARFRHVQVAGQQVHLCSTVGYEPGAPMTPLPWRMHGPETTKYFLALCSNREAPLPVLASSLITGDAHLKVAQSKLQELRADQAAKAERIDALRKQLDTMNQRIKDSQDALTIERQETARLRGQLEQARAQQQDAVAELQRQQRYFEKQVHDLHQEHRRARVDLRREIEALRNDPAVRRLMRFNTLGLKLLGLFGLGHGRRKRRARSAAPSAADGEDETRTDTLDDADRLSFEQVLDRTRANRARAKSMALLPDTARARLRDELRRRPQDTLVSVIMPTYNRGAKINEPIESVLRQDYKNWELLIVDDGGTDNTREVVAAYQEKHPNIHYHRIEHEGVSAARDTALHAAKGDLIAYLDSDNHWLDDYLLFMVHALKTTAAPCAYAALRIIDHDDAGKAYLRRRNFNLEALQRNNFIDINIFMHHRRLFDELGGFDRDLRRWVDWDLILRYVSHYDPVAVPLVGAVYNRQKKLNQITLDEPQAYKFKVLNKHLIDWPRLEAELPNRTPRLVSVVIPVFNQLDLTRACMRSLFNTDAGRPFEAVLVDNGSDDDTKRGLDALARDYPQLRIVTNYENYWFALGNNIGVANTTGEYIVLLNNDTEVTPRWLEPLIAPLESDPDVGAVGPKLLYADGTVQAAGFVFSDRSKIPYHVYRNAPADAPYVNKPRGFQALTGACLAVRAADFIALRGLDPVYANGCEDLDFCFALRFNRGKRLLYAPASVVYHHEGKTEGRNRAILYNRATFVGRWGPQVDPDDARLYAEDGFEVAEYFKPGREPDGETAAYVPELRARAEAGPTAAPPPPLDPARTLNVGIVSIWYVRGVTFVAGQLARALESDAIRTHVLARWESHRFDNSGPIAHPRVTNGGDDPTPKETVAWARANALDLVIFFEAHPKDWKRVDALQAAGIRVMVYEHLDVMRWEHIDKYARFDAALGVTFHTRDVFREHFPNMPFLLIPWGIPPEAVPAPVNREDDRLHFIHVAGWGGYNNRKNTDTLVRAFAKAAPNNAVLHFHTQAPIDQYGNDCAALLRDTQRFRVHQGTIPDIFDAYRDKDMLLWPSKREGLGLPITEALACGLPALISDGYMMKQWIIPGEHGLVVPARPESGRMFLPEVYVDEDQLAAAIRALCEDPRQIARFKENVRRDRDLWLWTWQPDVFREQLIRFLTEPGYRPPDDLRYIPDPVLQFEQRRRAAFGEQGLPGRA
ncbi:MAG TPA: glycosyltransferase [Candidatus Hydrogenedentes bacterium]|nr:glycosyltransferase [Candidatus Hydrogenedentota bacterium]